MRRVSMNAEQLNTIKERAKNTSFDKAYVKGDPWKGYEVKNEGNGILIAESPCGTDAEFIANARQDVPELVAEVERLQKDIKLVTKLLNNSLSRELSTVRAQREELEKNGDLREENKRLREALAFYAD